MGNKIQLKIVILEEKNGRSNETRRLNPEVSSKDKIELSESPKIFQ